MFDNWEKSLGAFVVFCFFFGGSCGDSRTIKMRNEENITFKECGLFTMSQRDPRIEYDVNLTNCAAAGALYQSIVAPIWIIGFHLWEPVGLKNGSSDPIDEETEKLAEEVKQLANSLDQKLRDSGLDIESKKVAAEINQIASKIKNDISIELDKINVELEEETTTTTTIKVRKKKRLPEKRWWEK